MQQYHQNYSIMIIIIIIHSIQTKLSPQVSTTLHWTNVPAGQCSSPACTWNYCAAATRDPRLHISIQTCGLLTVLTLILILWITGYGKYYRSVFIKSAKDVDELMLSLIEAWL